MVLCYLRNVCFVMFSNLYADVLVTGTKQTIMLLQDKVPLQVVLTGNWGGKVWQQLKASGSSPPWEKLRQSRFGIDTVTFGHIHRELRGETEKVNAEKTKLVGTAKGEVRQAVIQLGTQPPRYCDRTL